ncbi:YPC1 (YBR183W) and YDC1 (YPL087W) [Zygosaccharomyces parabailii]|nr:YPC1 (YBR183W) and YDC1 (YPL087W) [Zygosaccharomyces parabailii]
MFDFRKDYPSEPVEGHWGAVTSTIDWCEENYVISTWIAEWSNTLTNSFFTIFALYSTYCSVRNKLELRFVWIGLGFALVGVGSWLFHMTLKYQYQLLDELPMIYATCVPTWSLLCETPETLDPSTGPLKVSLKRQIRIGVILAVFVNALSLVYLVFKIPEIHHTIYGMFTVAVVLLSGIYTHLYVTEKVAKRSLYQCMALGIVLFLAGFISWNLDKFLCPFWIHIRRDWLKLPLGVFLELHAWWHLLTGAGVYCYIVFLQYLRVQTQGEGENFVLIWRWAVFPELIRVGDEVHTSYSLGFWGPWEDSNKGRIRLD